MITGKTTGAVFGVILQIFLISLSAAAYESIELKPSDTEQEIMLKAAGVTPSERQLAWQRLEYTGFVHFGMNTFTDKEWGEGTEDPALFNPAEFDARQWAGVFKAAGIKLLILTAKHHDGFCLWPSAHTEHSVKKSPWRGGSGDVVREVADACREAGIKFGVYLSPWDRHEPAYGTPAYNDYYISQLRELLTGYGEIAEVWMDGACGSFDTRCAKMVYDWDRIFAVVRELQPNAVISIYGRDVRWVGNEAGKPRDSEWSVQPESIDAMDPELGGRARLMEAAARSDTLRWYPAQTDTSIRPGWFYHRGEDFMVKPLDLLLDIYYGSVGGNSQLLLNVPPDRRGLITKYDIQRLKQLKRVLDATSDIDLSRGAVASADSSTGDHTPDNTIDGDPETYWLAELGKTTGEIVFDLGGPRTFDVASIEEYIAIGQRIEEFCLDALIGGEWKQIARSTTAGYRRLLRFEDVTTDSIRLRIIKSRGTPAVSGFGLFYDDGEIDKD